MNVLLLYKNSDAETADQILVLCKGLGMSVKKYPFESPWRSNVFHILAENSIIIAVVDKDFFKYASSVFISGYVLGKGMPLVLFEKNKYKMPDFFKNIPATGEIRFLSGILQREIEKYDLKEAREKARSALNAMGFKFTPDAFIKTVETGESKAVEWFLSGGMSPNLEDRNGVPLICLASRNNHKGIVDILLKKGAYINAVSKDRGNTALMDASAEADADLVSVLIAAGAELDIKSSSGQTALILAVGQKKEESASLLIKAGASVTLKDALGMSAEKYARLFNLSSIIELIEEVAES